MPKKRENQELGQNDYELKLKIEKKVELTSGDGVQERFLKSEKSTLANLLLNFIISSEVDQEEEGRGADADADAAREKEKALVQKMYVGVEKAAGGKLMALK